MLYDNHMHTMFSGDSEANPEDMILSAKNKNLGGITFTDHIDYDFPEDPNIFLIKDMDEYFSHLGNLSKKYTTPDFEVLTGIELGLQTQVVDWNRDFIKKYPFDVVIGSIHVVDHMDPYYPVFWENRSAAEGYKRYYELMLENVKSFSDFDTLGHLDYIFRYNRDSDAPDTYSTYRDIVDAILQEIIKKDIALEVNTGAYKSGMKFPNPAPSILRRYKELGGKMITVGADAHTPKNVADGFDLLPALLKECGFDSFVVFKKRKPYEIAI